MFAHGDYRLGLCLCIQPSETFITRNRVHILHLLCCSLDLTRFLHSRSKDAIVNIWDLPAPPPGVDNFAEVPPPPIVLDYFSKEEQGDLTSLHWNPDGTLLAIGSYDSVLRICTASGPLYFQHPQHQVICSLSAC